MPDEPTAVAPPTRPAGLDVEALLELCAKATPGPLYAGPFGTTAAIYSGPNRVAYFYGATSDIPDDEAKNNAQLFAEARTALPLALNHILALERQNAGLDRSNYIECDCLVCMNMPCTCNKSTRPEELRDVELLLKRSIGGQSVLPIALQHILTLEREIAGLRAANALLIDPVNKDAKDRDACELCSGFRGGVPGNENIIDGVTVCDYCAGTIYSHKRCIEAAKGGTAE